MEEEKELQVVVDPRTEEGLLSAESRPGPTWRAWVVSIIVAVALSVTATLLLGGASSFRPERVEASGGSGCGGACCPQSAK